MKRKWISVREKRPPANSEVWGWSCALNRASVFYVDRPSRALEYMSHWMRRTGKAPKHSPFAAHGSESK